MNSLAYSSEKKNQISDLQVDDIKIHYEYDTLGRIIEKTSTFKDSQLTGESFNYLRYGENTIDLVKEHSFWIGNSQVDSFEYDYDVAGNITSAVSDDYETRYQYDNLNRLVREDNSALGKSIVYKYDDGGNILFKKEYEYSLEDRLYLPLKTTNYGYSLSGNRDQLTHFDGLEISYDAMGRPTSIGEHILKWEGRGNLAAYDNFSYSYNMSGFRISKGNANSKTKYFILNGKILKEVTNDKDEIVYTYAGEKLIGFTYNDTQYVYERNIQGDVLKIYKASDLSLVAEYVYDAYGNHKAIDVSGDGIADINPIRYRGYYYDTETGLYYLNSRYYSPLIGRLISPDEFSILDETKSEINGLNLYMYCKDNPVMYVDPSGRFFVSISALVVGAVIGAVIGASVSVASQVIQKGWDGINWGQVGLDALFGAISGAVGAGTLGAVGQMLVNAGLSFIQSLATDKINGRDPDIFMACISALIGGGAGFLGGNGMQHASRFNDALVKTAAGNSSSVRNAIARYLADGISDRGLQGTMNLYLKDATFSFKYFLKGVALNSVIDGVGNSINSAFATGVISLLADWARQKIA